MSRAAVLVFTICALHAFTDAYLSPSDPLVAAKFEVQNSIRTINMQISINSRNLGMAIAPIRSQQAITLKNLIAEMYRSDAQCAVDGLRDAESTWLLINSLDGCRKDQEYEMIRAVAMPALNQLLGDAGRGIEACKQGVDYLGCATTIAAGVTESAGRVTDKALQDVQKVAGEATRCLADSADKLQDKMNVLVANWNECKTN